jgi:hypothetical protein
MRRPFIRVGPSTPDVATGRFDPAKYGMIITGAIELTEVAREQSATTPRERRGVSPPWVGGGLKVSK